MNNEYPRTVVLSNEKLSRLLQEKEDLILEGRVKSEEIDTVDIEMSVIDEEIKEYEKKVDIEDFRAEAESATKEFEKLMQRRDEINKKIFERMKAVVPVDLIKKYEAAKEKKGTLENERNKIALKVQKKMDKIIPIGRKAMQPNITDEYEDYDTLRIENGQVIGTIFSHMDEFIKRFHKDKK